MPRLRHRDAHARQLCEVAGKALALAPVQRLLALERTGLAADALVADDDVGLISGYIHASSTDAGSTGRAVGARGGGVG